MVAEDPTVINGRNAEGGHGPGATLDDPAPTVGAHSHGEAGLRVRWNPLDKPSPTLIGGSAVSHTNGVSILSETERGLLEALAETDRNASEETLRRHPGMELDRPGDAIRGGGDGHSASHQYLAMSNGMGRAEPVDLDNPSRPVLGRTAKDSTDLTRWVEQSAAKRGGSQSQRLLNEDFPAATLPSMGHGATGTHAPRLRADAIREGLIDGRQAYGGRKGGGLRHGERTLAPAQGTSTGRDFLPVMDRPSTTLAGTPRMSVPGHHDPDRRGASAQFTSAAGVRYRRLTWQECAKLQAFPEDYLWTGGMTALYRQIGNAVPPPLARAVALALLEALL